MICYDNKAPALGSKGPVLQHYFCFSSLVIKCTIKIHDSIIAVNGKAFPQTESRQIMSSHNFIDVYRVKRIDKTNLFIDVSSLWHRLSLFFFWDY